MPDIQRELLRVTPVEGLDGWETRLWLITYPPGADGSGHAHPVPGVGFVLEGTMLTAFGDEAVQTIPAGASFMDRTGVHTVSRNGSETEPMRFVIAYTVQSGERNTIQADEA